MQDFKFLENLLNYQPASGEIISLYLNTGPNESGKKDFPAFLKKQINNHGAVLDPNSAKKKGFESATTRITNFVEQLDPASKGTAIFSQATSDGLFETFEFAVPFDNDQFFFEDRPVLYPLFRIVAQNPKFAVAAADTNSAHIYVFRGGRIVDVDDIQNVKTNRTEVGGWSQARYQRHVENFHEQHAKEVVAELVKLCRLEKIDKVILAGDQTSVIPLIMDEISKELDEKIIDVLSLPVNTPEDVMLEAASDLLKKKESELDSEKIGALMEQNYENGLGVTGVEGTMAALMNGQVRELYIAAESDQITYDRGELRQILKAYQPGEDAALPDAAEHRTVVEELLRQGTESADEIRFISDPFLLKTHGGVGALLRYLAEGVSGI